MRTSWPYRWVAPGLVLAALLTAGGCTQGRAEPMPAVQNDAPAATVTTPTPDEPVSSARVGRPAASTRVRFVPTKIVLTGGSSAAVQPAVTVGGELKVPENVAHVGWWDGSAEAGDPFGSTVIAGHVDSATEGIGFFARLAGLRVGERVSLHGDGHRQIYQITSIRTVAKQALASDSDAFDQQRDHRLVLITCGGAYHRERGGYDSNLVLIASPVGSVR